VRRGERVLGFGIVRLAEKYGSVFEPSDLMDWESLVEELVSRGGSREHVDAGR
jgi:hypothetical protein